MIVIPIICGGAMGAALIWCGYTPSTAAWWVLSAAGLVSWIGGRIDGKLSRGDSERDE